MVTVKHVYGFDEDRKIEYHQITVKGHAKYDDTGRDIVCAAVSVLVESFVDTAIFLDDDRVKVEPGNVSIAFECASYDDYVHALVDMMMNGFGGLEYTYPENVSVEEVER